MLSKIVSYLDLIAAKPKQFAILSVIIAGLMLVVAAFAMMWKFAVVAAVFMLFSFVCAILASF
jgi:hypothetical protein